MKVSSDLLLQHALLDIGNFLSDAPEASARQFACTSLARSLLKKYEGAKAEDADQKALDLFLSVNDSLKQEVTPVSMLDEYLLGGLRKELYEFWYQSSDSGLVTGLHQVYSEGRTGPGKSLGSEYNDFYCKLHQSRLTVTSEYLYKSYRSSAASYPLTKASEELRAAALGECDVVRCSRLLFVPKRTDISRTICVEPSINMFYQLGLAQILKRRLRQVYSLDLSDQPDFNRELARLGSISDNMSTIDLSSASDSMSVGVLRNLLPRDFFSWLMALRTPAVKLPDGRVVALNMVSTMGNGFTFPLQTLLFAAIVRVAYKLAEVPFVRNTRENSGGRPGNWGVFGDDIVVVKSATSIVIRCLTLLGFKVNVDKSFVEGPFRESCGSDYFNGRFVRGVYIKSLKTMQDRYVAINKLNEWSAITGVPLTSTVKYLLRSVKYVPVPFTSGDDAGIRLPSMLVSLKVNRNGSYKFRYYQAQAEVWTVADDGTVQCGGRVRPGLVNEAGLLDSFLHGTVRSGTITSRLEKDATYRMRPAVVPSWDYCPEYRSNRRFSFTQWETAVCLNLS